MPGAWLVQRSVEGGRELCAPANNLPVDCHCRWQLPNTKVINVFYGLLGNCQETERVWMRQGWERVSSGGNVAAKLYSPQTRNPTQLQLARPRALVYGTQSAVQLISIEIFSESEEQKWQFQWTISLLAVNYNAFLMLPYDGLFTPPPPFLSLPASSCGRNELKWHKPNSNWSGRVHWACGFFWNVEQLNATD